MKIVYWGMSILTACEFPARSERYACVTTVDCESGRICESSYCILGSADGGGGGTDSRSADGRTIDMPPPHPCEVAGYTYQSGPAGYYRSVGTGMSWTDAQAACKADVAGSSHLIVLSTQAEVTYMATQLGWIGLSDRATETQFVTVTGEVGDKRPWTSGEPDDGGRGGSEDCARMKSGGQLDDNDCGTNQPYVCECDGKPSTP